MIHEKHTPTPKNVADPSTTPFAYTMRRMVSVTTVGAERASPRSTMRDAQCVVETPSLNARLRDAATVSEM